VSRRRQVSVIGASRADDQLSAKAEEVGRRLAEAGLVVVCGGMSGVMEGASRGATGAGGEVIGILPGAEPDDANEHVTHVVASGIGFGRNLSVVASGDAVIAIGGEWGTLSEIAFARNLERPVVALETWELTRRDGTDPGLTIVETPEAAVAAVLEVLL
jgi:uncharacterized protein (TIGR00725 family)